MKNTKLCSLIKTTFSRNIPRNPRDTKNPDLVGKPRGGNIVAETYGMLFVYNVNKVFTRNSSGDEIANVNFLYDDIVHAVKIQ